jgi:hypothetical protein
MHNAAWKAYPQQGLFTLMLADRKLFLEFRKALNRALNTYDDAPRWLFDLADELEDDPIV